MSDCIFCKIVKGEIPSTKVYEDDDVLAFRDLHPVAPTHVLLVPKKHFANILELNKNPEEAGLVLSAINRAAEAVAKAEGLDNGFRLINNCGEEGGQTVMHLHVHLIGGKALGEGLI